jgi:NAD(P)-dependent dehydrogenase (short-subunit alcohol dehydrogenase family)
MDLRGKRVLITGGAAGLGAATAAALARKGCALTLLDLDAAAGEATVRCRSAPAPHARAGRKAGCPCRAAARLQRVCVAAVARAAGADTALTPRRLRRCALPARTPPSSAAT